MIQKERTVELLSEEKIRCVAGGLCKCYDEYGNVVGENHSILESMKCHYWCHSPHSIRNDVLISEIEQPIN